MLYRLIGLPCGIYPVAAMMLICVMQSNGFPENGGGLVIGAFT